MALFSYHGGVPSLLPEELSGASLERLESLGYSGPFDAPSFDPRLEKAQWDGSQWQITALSSEEIEAASLQRALKRANWQGLSEGLMTSQAYGKARAAAATSLQANVDATELIAFLADARAGRPFIAGINSVFASIDNETELTAEDKAELDAIIRDNGLSGILVVPGYESDAEEE
jgi:hypothetical protein